MESQSYFAYLSTELLIKIFNYLDISDLCKLKQTCKRFNEVINSWDHVLLKDIYPLVTNQQSNIFLSRCQQHLSTFEKVRISKNWQMGRFREKDLLFVKRKYMPWLYLTDKSVWISRGRNIYCYERFTQHVNVSRPRAVLHGRSNADVGHFQIKNNLIISGQRDGSMWLTTLQDRKVIFDEKDCHESDINSVDISHNGDIIVSGSRDSSFKVWRVDYDSETGALKKSHNQVFFDRVLRVSLLDEQPLLAVGTSGNDYRAPLFVYDIERILDPIELSASRYGSGVLDLKWDGPHTIWSCGYDTCLRRWDLRTGKSEQNFYDPHASVLYCMEYDYYNTIMTGTQSYGRVILWDIRQPHSLQAKTALRKKHELQKRVEKKANALHNIQTLLEQIHETHTDAHVWEAYKNALSAFNTTFKDTGMTEDVIDDTMIRLGDVLEMHNDIQTALARPAIETDDTDLEEELAELIKDDANNPPPDDSGITDLEHQLEKLTLNLPDVPDKSPDVSVKELSINN